MVPSLDDLPDPFLMQDMDIAVERLALALENGEKILIYGDYDVDGTTSVALVYGYLTEILGADADYYIPDRYSEGYGVSQAGIQYAYDNDYSLIISLDCGIKAHERVDWCNEMGIDFIICDHHLPGNELPNASAIFPSWKSPTRIVDTFAIDAPNFEPKSATSTLLSAFKTASSGRTNLAVIAKKNVLNLSAMP
jgi:single-stranded DNA-specific DHH superfamily exonuclease